MGKNSFLIRKNEKKNEKYFSEIEPFEKIFFVKQQNISRI